MNQSPFQCFATSMTHPLEMQQYIDLSSYHDTLGNDTVSIHI